MRITEEIKKAARPRKPRKNAASEPVAPLKGADSALDRIRRAGARSALLAAMYVAGMLFVVPAVAYVLISAKTGFLRLAESCAAYFPAHILDGWAVVVGLPQWQTPTLVTAVAVTALFALVGVYLYAQPGDLGDKKQLYGPAASGTNEQGSAKLYTDERLLKEITQTWDGTWEGGKDVAGGIVLGYSEREGHFYVSNPEHHTVTFGSTGSGKTVRCLYPSVGLCVASGDSILLSDPKGEIYDATGEDVRKRLFDVYGEDRVHVLDFRNTNRSECYNPMDHIWNTYVGYKRSSDAHFEAAYALLADEERCLDPDRPEAVSSWADPDDRKRYLAELRSGSADKVLAWSKAEEAAVDLAVTIIPENPDAPGAHWETTARMALRAVILLVGTVTDEDIVGEGEEVTPPLREQRTLESVKRIFERYGGKTKPNKPSPLIRLFDRLDPRHPAVPAIAQLRNSADKEYGTTVAETIKFLDEYLGMAVNQVMNRSDFDLASFGTKQQVLYVVLPDDRPAVGKVFSILVTQMYQALVAEAIRLGKKVPVTVRIILEEAANLKIQVPELPSKLSMARGYNLRFHLILQGDKQLVDLYGREGLENLLISCKTQIMLQTNDVNGVGKRFSDAMGVYTVRSPRVTRSRKTLAVADESANRSTDQIQRPLMYPDEVCKWDPSWGSIVIQDETGKAPTRRAVRLGYRTKQPCVYPTAPAWETPVAKILGIGDMRQMEAKAARMEAESRLDARTPNIAWEPYTSEDERVVVERSLRKGTLSEGAKADMAHYARRREDDQEACDLLLETEAVASVGEEITDEEVSEILRQAKAIADDRQRFALNDYETEDYDDDYIEAVRNKFLALKTAATRVLWRTAAEAMASQDAGKALRDALSAGAVPPEVKGPEESGPAANGQAGEAHDAAGTAKEDPAAAEAEPAGSGKKAPGKKGSKGRRGGVASRLEAEVRKGRRAESGPPAEDGKDNSWVDDIREAAAACLEASADMGQYAAELSEAGVDLRETANGRDLLYVSSGGEATGKTLGPRFTKRRVEDRFSGKPRTERKSLAASMGRVLESNGYDVADLLSEMEAKGVTFDDVVAEHPGLATWSESLQRYDCKWSRLLRVLADEHGIHAKTKAA